MKATSAVEGPQAAVPPQASAPQPVVLPTQQEPEEEESFYFEEEQPDLVGTPFVAPFQLSSAMPMMAAQEQPSGQASAGPATVKKSGRTPRFSLTMIAILLCVVVLVGLLVMNALAQTTPPLQTHGNGTSPTTHQPGPPQQKPPGNQQTLTMQPTPAPTNGTHGQGQGQASTDWVPQQFPDGWTQAGLLTEDAIQAIRTAVAFTDREMSLDYRSVGTRDNHGGTFTAATFVLTPAARQRFAHNDVREINNTLFDMVENTRLVRVVLGSAATARQICRAAPAAVRLGRCGVPTLAISDRSQSSEASDGRKRHRPGHEPAAHPAHDRAALARPAAKRREQPGDGGNWLARQCVHAQSSAWNASSYCAASVRGGCMIRAQEGMASVENGEHFRQRGPSRLPHQMTGASVAPGLHDLLTRPLSSRTGSRQL